MSAKHTYPNFAKTNLQSKDLIKKITYKYPTYSDFNLLSMLAWDSEGVNGFSILNDNLVIRIASYLAEGFEYSVIGDTKTDETVEILVKDYKKLSLVPKLVVDNIINKEKYTISPDRDNFDYIINLKDLVELDGGKYKPLRRYINSFNKQNPDFEIQKLDIHNQAVIDEIIVLTRNWCESKNFTQEETKQEITDTSLYLKFATKFDTINIGMYLNKNLIAYTANEIVQDGVIMGHFGKALNKYKGNSYFMEYQTAKYLLENGYKTLNHEQDCGLLGLRETKCTYQPNRFLEKFTISLK